MSCLLEPKLNVWWPNKYRWANHHSHMFYFTQLCLIFHEFNIFFIVKFHFGLFHSRWLFMLQVTIFHIFFGWKQDARQCISRTHFLFNFPHCIFLWIVACALCSNGVPLSFTRESTIILLQFVQLSLFLSQRCEPNFSSSTVKTPICVGSWSAHFFLNLFHLFTVFGLFVDVFFFLSRWAHI